MSDRVRYQYDNLEEFARKFADHASDTEHARARLNVQLALLEGGGWLGEAAQRFSAEMHNQILPALAALTRALEGTHAALLRATNMMRDAENEAASLFRAVELSPMQALGAAAGPGIAAAGAAALGGIAAAGAGAGAAGAAALQGAGSADRAQQIASLTGLRDEQTRFVDDLRRGIEGLGGQFAGVQQAYDRLLSEAAARAQRMTALIGSIQAGTAL